MIETKIANVMDYLSKYMVMAILSNLIIIM